MEYKFRHDQNKQKGFSLVELMYTLLIAGILIGIAVPGYNKYITKSRRRDGQIALLDLAGRMERYYSEKSTYATATIASNIKTDIISSKLSAGKWYILSIVEKGDDSYLIQASPRSYQAINDTKCQSLTISDIGERGITTGPCGSPSGTADECW